MDLVHQLLENSALHSPDQEALVYKNRRMSYQEVNERANQLARSLLKAGVKPGDRVAVYLEKNPEQVISIFAISKIGAVFLVLNPRVDEDLLPYMINDCGAKGIISSGIKIHALLSRLPRTTIEFAVLTSPCKEKIPQEIKAVEFDSILLEDTSDLDIKAEENGLASIFYTSGSTGMPKGVMLTHKNLVYGARSYREYLNNTKNDRILSLLPLSFTLGFQQLTSCFEAQATLVLKTYLAPEEVIEVMETEGITGLAGVPTIWLGLLEARNIGQYEFRKLRYITCSGYILSGRHLHKLKETFPHTDVFLMYGFTEGLGATYLPPEEIERRPGSIGKAIPYAKIFVLNEHGKETQAGETGELVQGGPLVSSGYWGKPEQTALKIRQNPLVKDRQDLVYYSGDMVKKDEDGFIYYVARKDSFIKSCGYRIGPYEIESKLHEHEKVHQAVVLGIPDERLGQKIKAVITLKRKGDAAEGEILEFCAKRMPSYMVPHGIIIIEEMPATPNGKIDRAAIYSRYGTKLE